MPGVVVLIGGVFLVKQLALPAKFSELLESFGEVFKEKLFIVGIFLNIGTEFLVLNEGHVGGEHHQFSLIKCATF